MLGVQGGAGATTVAALLRDAVDLSPVGRRRWRWAEYATHWTWLPLVLVARGTARGTADAVAAVDEVATMGLRPAVLAVVGDGWWPEPAAVRARLAMLSARVGAVVRIPYVPRWRYVDDPLAAEPPARVSAAVERIRVALTTEY